MDVNVWTDGACQSGVGGYGYVVMYSGNVIAKGGGRCNTTNQRMEIEAVIGAIKCIIENNLTDERITVFSDSKYVVNTIMECWNRNANVDLWDVLYGMLSKIGYIRFVWVKGHSTNKYNNICDKIATNEVKRLKSKM